MSRISRRTFLKTTAATGALAGIGTLPAFADHGSATDWVTLGKSGVKVTRLAFGTGSKSGEVQQALGQEGFTRLVRHAYDNGIRFFETSESYGDSQQMLGVALKGISRDSYKLMTKVTTDSRHRHDRKTRRAPPQQQNRLFRHHAASLAARWPLARRHNALAGRRPRSSASRDRS